VFGELNAIIGNAAGNASGKVLLSAGALLLCFGAKAEILAATLPPVALARISD
jgi:hypothetical protein